MHWSPKVFEHRSVIDTTLEGIVRFHEHPKALSRLTPPPVFIQVLHDERVSLTEGDVEFRLWLGPFPARWLARHEPGPELFSFADRMLQGPLAVWRHEHIFRPVEGGVKLLDRITLSHYAGWGGFLTRLIFDGPALRLLFHYRHWRTKWALSARTRRMSIGIVLAAIAVTAVGAALLRRRPDRWSKPG